MYVDLVLLDLGILIVAEEGRGLPHVHLAGGGLHIVELDEVPGDNEDAVRGGRDASRQQDSRGSAN